MSHYTLFLSAIILSLTFVLSGCGGGGGGSDYGFNDRNLSEQPPANEQQATLGAALMKAPAAYSRNLTGAGVTIGY